MMDEETGEQWLTSDTRPPEPILCPPKLPRLPIVEVLVPALKTTYDPDFMGDDQESLHTPTTSTHVQKPTISPLRPGRKRDQPESPLEVSSGEGNTNIRRSRRQPKHQKTAQLINLISTDSDDGDYVATAVPEDSESNDDGETSGGNGASGEDVVMKAKGRDPDTKKKASTSTTPLPGKTKAMMKKKEGYYLSERACLWDTKAPQIPQGAWTEEQFIRDKRVGAMQQAVCE